MRQADGRYLAAASTAFRRGRNGRESVASSSATAMAARSAASRSISEHAIAAGGPPEASRLWSAGARPSRGGRALRRDSRSSDAGSRRSCGPATCSSPMLSPTRVTGWSYLNTHRADGVLLALTSIACWWLFEWYNAPRFWRGGAHAAGLWWQYHGMEPNLWLRRLGYDWAFATIFPALFLTAAILRASVFRGVRVPPWRPSPSALGWLSVVVPSWSRCTAIVSRGSCARVAGWHSARADECLAGRPSWLGDLGVVSLAAAGVLAPAPSAGFVGFGTTGETQTTTGAVLGHVRSSRCPCRLNTAHPVRAEATRLPWRAGGSGRRRGAGL